MLSPNRDCQRGCRVISDVVGCSTIHRCPNAPASRQTSTTRAIIVLAAATDGDDAEPSGCVELLPVEPLDMNTQVPHTGAAQHPPPGRSLKTAVMESLSCVMRNQVTHCVQYSIEPHQQTQPRSSDPDKKPALCKKSIAGL